MQTGGTVWRISRLKSARKHAAMGEGRYAKRRGLYAKKSSATDSLSSALIILRVRPLRRCFYLFYTTDIYIYAKDERDEIQHLAFSLFARR